SPGLRLKWAAIPAVGAGVYYLLALVAALRWIRRSQRPGDSETPPVSILKPVHGRDPGFYDAILSHAMQDYPEFEILFGTGDPKDPALADIELLQRKFPAVRIETLITPTNAPNAKAGVLAELARHARYDVLLVDDSDILVPEGYLSAVTERLGRPGVGLVTCLYRASGASTAARAEALGIA